MSADKQNTPGSSNEPKDGGTSWGRATSYVLLALFGIFAAMIFVWSGMIAQVLSFIFPTVYYTQVFADVTAEGQRFQLTSTAKCTLRSKARWGGLVGGGTPATINGGLLVKRLPSGAGLIIIGPALCEKADLNKFIHKKKFASDTEVRTIDLQKYLDFRKGGRWPKVLLLDDAASPSLITSYFREYVTRPDASVRIHSITYKRKTSGKLADPEKEIPWLQGRKKPTRIVCKHTPWDWVGYFTYVVPEDAWYSIKELRYVGNIVSIKSIKLPKALKIFKHSIESLEFKKNITAFLIRETDKNSLGILKFKKKNFFSNEKYIPQFDIVSNGERIKKPIGGFFDPHTRTIRLIGRQPYSKDAVCR